MFEVGSLKPNDLGLFDILGNAIEWCGDAWVGSYTHRRLDRPSDDVGDVSALGDKAPRVLRGGSFGVLSSLQRSANRNYALPSNRENLAGFRMARTLPSGSLAASPASPKGH
jgi:formylglycine-generating enzyme required for sulfatase activity